MNQKDLIKKYQKKYFKNNELFILKGIYDVNHKPHPFMIGPKHIAHAANNYNGTLGNETLKAVKCAHPGCNLFYDEHTFDTVMFLQLKRNGTSKEANNFLLPLKEDMLSDNIDGISLVETDEKYRIKNEL